MTPAAIAKELFAGYGEFRLDHLTPASCIHEVVHEQLNELVAQSPEALSMREIGTSLEERSLKLITAGTGERRVLLWSQMHGDEPTATLALLDILHFLATIPRPPWVREMLAELTICMVPMVNPDGAQRRERRNAAGIDINRDARACTTPEARTLIRIHRELRPVFGFNLHDQELNSVGGTRSVACLALLAPPADAERTITPTRLRAMRIAALISRVLKPYAGGHLARYDDSYEPRAFGDTFQRVGTSTVLIESGDWPGDSEKTFIRMLNVVALLSSLHAITRWSYKDADLDHYLHLPPNGKQLFDLLIRGLELQHSSGWSAEIDLGLVRQRGTDVLTVKDLGDLSTFAGLETIDVNRRPLPPVLARPGAVITRKNLMDLLQIHS